jgi:hypothetical protein
VSACWRPPLSFPGFNVGLTVHDALQDPRRGTDLRFGRLQDRIAGRSGPGGERLAEVAVAGVLGGIIRLCQPFGEGPAPGGQVLDPQARPGNVLPGSPAEPGALGIGSSRRFGRTERGEPLTRMPAARTWRSSSPTHGGVQAVSMG